MGINIDLILPEFCETVREILPNFTCSICKDLLEDSVMIKQCDHIFCRSCLTEWVKSQNKGTNAPCPECRELFASSDVKELRVIRNMLSTFEFKCVHEPCNEIIRYDDLNAHPQECNYFYTKCTFCNEETLVKDLDQHNDECIKYIKNQKLELENEVDSLKIENNSLNLEVKRLKWKLAAKRFPQENNNYDSYSFGGNSYGGNRRFENFSGTRGYLGHGGNSSY